MQDDRTMDQRREQKKWEPYAGEDSPRSFQSIHNAVMLHSEMQRRVDRLHPNDECAKR